MTALPDVNVLVALAWPNHVHHRAARAWFDSASREGWATTVITELGFVRVSSNPRAVPAARPPQEVLAVLARLCARGDHEFWSDGTRLLDADPGRLGSYRQVTDAHLLALAGARGGVVVTFDRGLLQLSVDRPPEALLLLTS